MSNEFRESLFFPPNPLPLLFMAFVCGGLTGLFRDILQSPIRIFSKKSKKTDMCIKLIGEGCNTFALCFGYVALFVCALNTEHGILRWYHIALSLCGATVYRSILSRPVCTLVDGTYLLVERILTMIFKYLLKILLFPFRPIFRFLGAFIRKKSAKRREKAYKKRAERCYLRAKRDLARDAARGFDLI